jgi:hypothetical protein
MLPFQGRFLHRVRPTISEELADELLPAAPDLFIPHFSAVAAEDPAERLKEARELQERLNVGAQLLQDEQRGEVAKAGSVRDRALRNVNRAPGASLCFTTMPTREELEQSAEVVSIGERLHLGLPPKRNMPLHCSCNHANGSFGLDGWHALSCVLGKGGATRRHDDVKYALARWVTRLGGRVRVEPRADGGHPADDERGHRKRGRRRARGRQAAAAAAVVGGERKERPEEQAGADKSRRRRFDLMIWGLGTPIAVDVRVTHSLAPSHVEQCAEDAEAVLEAAEAEKARVYRVLADQVGAKFFAFAVDTAGRLGTEALALIRHLIQEGARFKNVVAPKEVVQGIYRTVAIAVARGNAEMVQSNLVRSRLAEW